MNAWPGVIERYRPLLPVSANTAVVTLHEGNAPLVPAPRLAEATDRSSHIFLERERSTLVLTLTDHGLKDPDTALESATRPVSVPARLDAVLSQRGL